MKTSVISNDRIADNTQRIIFQRPQNYMYDPGNYLTIPFQDARRYLSIVSSPHEPQLEVAIRLSGSQFKQYLLNLQPGDSVDISKSGGSLLAGSSGSHPVVMLAGGIGITPFVSITRDLSQHLDGAANKVTVLHSNRYRSEAVYMDELSRLASENNLFTYEAYLTREKHYNRHISASDIARAMAGRGNSKVLIAGSHRFIQGMYVNLSELAVPVDNVVAEVFCGYCPEHVCCCERVAYR